MLSAQNIQPTILSLPSHTGFVLRYTDSFVQLNLEQATPASLRRAVERLYDTSHKLTAEKQFQLILAARLMKLLYPLEIVDWNVPGYKNNNQYLEALTKIENGIYPQTLGTSSFFDAIIPAIILTKGMGGKEYGTVLENRLFTARNINSQSVLPFYLLGLLYEQLNNFSDAEDSYQVAWERDDSCYPAGIRFARLSLIRNNLKKACEISEKLYERYPDSVIIQLLLTEAYIKIGSLDQAESLIYTILKKDNEQEDVFFLRILFHIERKEYLLASALLDEFAKKSKVDKAYLLLRERILREWSKNISEAKQCLEKADSLYPQAGDVMLACANFCFETKNTINGKTANDFIDLLLRQSPRNILAIRLLVKQDIGEKHWEDAFERAQYLYSVRSSEEDIILYARVCAGMNNWQEAITVAYTAYTAAQNPSDDIITLYLETLYGAKEYEKIKQIIARHLPEARSSLKSVLVYYQSLLETDEEKKLSLLRLSLLSDPRSSSTLFALYEWYFKHKDYRKASYYLQQVIALHPDDKIYLELASKLEKLQSKSKASGY